MSEPPEPASREGFVTLIRWLGVFTPLAIVGGPSPADIACTLIATLFLAHTLWSRDFGWLRQDWLIVGLTLWAYFCLRSVIGEAGGNGLVLALTFVRFLLFAAALQSLILTEDLWRRRLAMVAAMALGALALDAIFQYVTRRDVLGHPAHDFRLTGFYNHPWVGAMLSWLFLPVALSLADQRRYKLAAVFGALCLTAILLSGDRMALLAALLALAALGLLFKRARRIFLIAVPVVVLLAGVFLASNRIVYDRQVASTIETIHSFPQSHYAAIWKSTIKIWRDYPLFGTGRGGYRAVCSDPKYGPLFPIGPGESRCATHTHNIYLEWLVESGLLGLALFLLMLAAIFRHFIRGLAGADWAYCGLFVTVIARLWPLASWTSFHQAWSAVPFWLVIGWGLS